MISELFLLLIIDNNQRHHENPSSIKQVQLFLWGVGERLLVVTKLCVCTDWWLLIVNFVQTFYKLTVELETIHPFSFIFVPGENKNILLLLVNLSGRYSQITESLSKVLDRLYWLFSYIVYISFKIKLCIKVSFLLFLETIKVVLLNRASWSCSQDRVRFLFYVS